LKKLKVISKLAKWETNHVRKQEYQNIYRDNWLVNER
jgi:hypothetical protein